MPESILKTEHLTFSYPAEDQQPKVVLEEVEEMILMAHA